MTELSKVIELPKIPTREEFFARLNAEGVTLTYDDVRLRTGYSEVMPSNVDLSSKFSRRVPLKMPLVSAAMDTVTEYKLAIAMAKLGGLGIIHKNLTAEEQAAQVARVKLHLNGLIEGPITVRPDQTIEEVLNYKEKKDFGFHTFPVVDDENRLVGILTRNDFDFCDNISSRVGEVMTKELITVNEGTNIETAYQRMKCEKKKALPVIDDSGHLLGLYIFSDVQRIITKSSDLYNIDENNQLRVGAAIGVLDEAMERLKHLVRKGVDVVVIDTAHGDSKNVIETLKRIKIQYDVDVVVGNISEAMSAKSLCEVGADGIKVGQGPGSICTTRVIAGIGCPQITAVYNCAFVADQFEVPVCADGGVKYSGDVPIAIGAGAHSVMMGSVFAGTAETPGEVILYQGRRWKDYRGMGSLGAMQESQGSRDRYLQEKGKPLIPEGVEGIVPFKGPLSSVVEQYVGGLRAGMGYVGAADINELRTKTNFLQMTGAGQRESHPHNVTVTKEAPNYSETGGR